MFERRRRSLKLGIHLDIIAALGERIDRRLLRQALRFYTSNIHYRASQKPGVPRTDLYGNACGAVSEADAHSAAGDVAARKTRKRPRAEPEISPAPPASPPAPKRDGLAALREAAKRRRQEVA
jgi:sRNA-binding protein